MCASASVVPFVGGGGAFGNATLCDQSRYQPRRRYVEGIVSGVHPIGRQLDRNEASVPRLAHDLGDLSRVSVFDGDVLHSIIHGPVDGRPGETDVEWNPVIIRSKGL